MDAEYFRRHYASLSDEELLRIERDELTEVACKCFDQEMNKRGLVGTKEESTEVESEAVALPLTVASDEVDDELLAGETFVVSSYLESPGAAADADDAYKALRAAGIPCRVDETLSEAEPAQPPGKLLQVVVPSSLTLQATSIVDRDVHNPWIEMDWRTHLSSLTDEEFSKISPEVICAGLLDRAARLKKAYLEELRKRNLKAQGSSAH